VILLTGCRVDARVEIAMHPDGSGVVTASVTLDADAAQRVGGTGALRLDDLQAAGWVVQRDARSITMTRSFVDTADLSHALTQLGGVLGDASVTRDRRRFSSRDALSVVVDTRALSARVASDPLLSSRLKTAGVDVAALSKQFDAQLRDAFHLTVVLRLPDGTTRTVSAPSGARTAVAISKTHEDQARKTLLAIGAGLALVAVVLGLFGLRRRSRSTL
jgi:hypothetical protein